MLRALLLVGVLTALPLERAAQFASTPGDLRTVPTLGTPDAACPVGHALRDGACVPALDAYAAPGATTYVVDASDPRAADDGPGTPDRPWRTIGRSTRPGTLRPGDAVLVRGGVYREAIHPTVGGTGPDARITFAAYPGEEVVVTGADPAPDGWTRAGASVWRRAWDGPPLPTYAEGAVFRREMVIVDGAVLRFVERVADLRPGTFTVTGSDVAQEHVWVRFPGDAGPQDVRSIELAVRTHLFMPRGPDPYADCGDPATPGWFRLVGLRFRHASNRAQWGAVCAGSAGGLVENVVAEWTNGMGVDGSGRGHVFRGVRADNNGQMGWGAACSGCLFEDNSAVGNNWKGYDPFWEAGGGKWHGTSQTVIRRHYSAHNDGPGIWLDIDNDANTIEDCLVVGNQVAGIMLELRTTRTLVQHNVVAGTRWRDWSGSGILSQAASHNVLLHNTVEANEGTGVWLRLDPLRRAPDGHTVVRATVLQGNAAAPHVEAREVSAEGETAAQLRSHRFQDNVYGVVAGDPVLRSAFFAAPVAGGDLRGNDLAAWQRAVGGDPGSVRSARAAPPPAATAALAERAGAAAAPARLLPRRGADLARVRAGGNWRDAPPRVWPITR